jgi:hypothetical protein
VVGIVEDIVLVGIEVAVASDNHLVLEDNYQVDIEVVVDNLVLVVGCILDCMHLEGHLVVVCYHHNLVGKPNHHIHHLTSRLHFHRSV